MTYSEVKELLAAGFTHDEIMGFSQESNPQFPQSNPQETPNVSSTVPAEHPEKLPDQEQDPAAVSADLSAAAPENTNDQRFDQLNATMEKLIKTIQTSNLHTSSFDTNQAEDLNTQVDSIMKSIIRPEHEKKGDSK